MKDSMGRGFWERRREASFEHSHESDNERREELKKHSRANQVPI